MKKKLAAMAMLLLCGFALAEPATVTRATELRATAAINGKVLAKLAAGAELELVSTTAGWSAVETDDGKTGFVRRLNLKPLAPPAESAATAAPRAGSANSGVSTLGNVLRTGSTGAVATTGVKGLSKDDLAKAAPNPAEVAQLERYAVKADDARSAARGAKLTAQNVPLEGN